MNNSPRITPAAIVLVSIAILVSLVAATPTAKNVKSTSAVTLNKTRVARGQYLVRIGGCNDCHTPLKMGAQGPEPDMSRMLSGHPAQLTMPPAPKLPDGPWVWIGSGTNTAFAGPWGISYAMNLTPDKVTGLGIWTEEMFVRTLRTGRHWGTSRPILPPMPWQNAAQMTDEDLKSVYAYLRSIPAIRNEVPDAIIAPPPKPKA
jgi:hypothetical protein